MNNHRWWCDDCRSPVMSRAEMVEHLQKLHGINPDAELKCKRAVIGRVEDAGFTQTAWHVIIAGINLVCSEIAGKGKRRINGRRARRRC